MFEYSYMPIWLIVLLGIIALIAITSLSIANYNKYYPEGALHGGLLGFVISAVVCLIAFGISIPVSHTTTNDPHKIENVHVVINKKVNTEKVDAFLEQATGYDHVSSSVPTGDRSTGDKNIVKELRNGKITSFTAIDNDKTITGSFYFDKDQVVIVASDEKDMLNKWTVGIN